ncbi:MAG TPA: hypothetical protein DDZ42_07025 [Candidatus Rokubacteria bacterium]|nr:hypothetical protein [Candidatus Rokubacteria bacterium]
MQCNRRLAMERQLTLRMPAELATKLERAAKRLKRRRSDIVRLAVEEFLAGSAASPEIRPVERVRDLLGRLESGVPDLGQRHREHLLSRLRRDR